jgi:hypothetical protein
LVVVAGCSQRIRHVYSDCMPTLALPTERQSVQRCAAVPRLATTDSTPKPRDVGALCPRLHEALVLGIVLEADGARAVRDARGFVRRVPVDGYGEPVTVVLWVKVIACGGGGQAVSEDSLVLAP